MGCTTAIGCICCILILAAGSICAWRFGPWYDDGAATNDSGAGPMILAALDACEGCCNGLASNCDLAVNDVLFPMVHNAHSSRDDFFAGYNNNRPLEEALVAGYRGLMLDSCICDGSIGEAIQNYLKGTSNGDNYLGFCHTSCDAGNRDPATVLDNIKTFLDINRNEVLILEFEIRDNSLADLYQAIDWSGLDSYVYHSPSIPNDWPTMRQLIDANTRVLLFAHGDGMESCTSMNCPEGIFYTYDHFEQTNWNDDTCDIAGTKYEGREFFLMNHWKNNDYDLPSKSNAEGFNTYNSLMDRFGTCEDKIPNLIAVDFWDVGDVLNFSKEVNKRKAGGQTVTAEAFARIEGV